MKKTSLVLAVTLAALLGACGKEESAAPEAAAPEAAAPAPEAAAPAAAHARCVRSAPSAISTMTITSISTPRRLKSATSSLACARTSLARNCKLSMNRIA